MCATIWFTEETTHSQEHMMWCHLVADVNHYQLRSFILNQTEDIDLINSNKNNKICREGFSTQSKGKMGGDVTGCHSPMSVNDDVTALTPAEKHIHTVLYTDASHIHTQTYTGTNSKAYKAINKDDTPNTTHLHNLGGALTLLLHRKRTQCCPNAS